jgi:protein-S-isoprenylcysteine O-methyltransferase Ste14
MAQPRDALQIPLSLNERDYVRGALIALAAIPISAVLWGLFTGRWMAESRRARKLHRHAASVSPVMRVPPPWLFILIYLVGVALQRILPMGIRSPELASIIRLAGFVFVVAGIAFGASALGIFKKAKTTTVPFETPSTLVISGPYRFTRNPMYMGLTLLYLGVAGTRSEIWPVIVLPLMLAYVNFVVIPVEERNLAGVFGESYQQYRAKVRRWI